MHVCRVIILLASRHHGGMAPMNGVLERKDTDSLGSIGRGDEEGTSLSVSMTS